MIAPSTIGEFRVLAASFFSTHHASPADLVAGRERPVTKPSYPLLVGRARRFTSLVTQLHAEVCGALPAGDEPASAVFATYHGEIDTAEKLIADIRDNAMVSAARFAQSVHNTASGVYSVATGRTHPTTTVTGEHAIASGWLEAALTTLDLGRTVLLSIADEPVPAALAGPAEVAGVAAAFLLGPASASGRRARLVITDASDEAPAGTPRTLAGAADAATRGDAAAVVLGSVQPGTTLVLQLLGEEPRT